MRITQFVGFITPRSCRTHDSLLSRLSNDDDMEKSLSTFANEMASCAMILGTYSNIAFRLCLHTLLQVLRRIGLWCWWMKWEEEPLRRKELGSRML